MQFAYLVPTSKSAEVSIKHRANKMRSAQAQAFAQLHTLPSRQMVANLNFSMLFGKRSISFGTARAVEYHIPHQTAPGVDRTHFLIHFDANGFLNLTDTSLRGTWIAHDGVWQLLHRATIRLGRDCHIKIIDEAGKASISFRIVIANAAKDNMRVKTFLNSARALVNRQVAMSLLASSVEIGGIEHVE